MILAIECNKDLIYSYALYDYETKKLKKYGIEHLKSYSLPKLLLEIYVLTEKLIKENKVGRVAMKVQDLSKNNKSTLMIESKMRGVIQVSSVKAKALFQNLETNGWFLKITNGVNTPKKKLKLLKKFGIELKESENLKVDEHSLIDILLLGEAYVNDKLQIGVE